MGSDYLSNYLNDHLAGSVMAIELLDDIASRYAEADAGILAKELKAKVLADRKELETLMNNLHVRIGAMRRFSAWTMEKLSQAKMRFDDPGGGSFRLLESLEALSLGIEGKRMLWIALAEAAEVDSSLARVDYKILQQRADDQRSQVEALRRRIAQIAFKRSA